MRPWPDKEPTVTEQTGANNTWSKYRDQIRPISELPPRTAEELAYQKDPDAQERRELRKLWKEERPEFNRLEDLAVGLKIKRVIVTPASPSTILGRYLPEGNWESDLAQEWGLSERQENSILKSGPTILICRDTAYEEGACRFLAHEIGHHLCRLAKFAPKQQNQSVTKTLCRFFPDNTYLKNQKSQDELRSECFAEYLTVSAIRRGIERECKAILNRVRRHDHSAAKLVEQYRTTLLERARPTGTRNESSR